MKGFGIISHDVKAAAFRRPLRAEGADNHMPACFYRQCGIPDISNPIFWLRQEVKDRAIMPDIVGMGRKNRLRDICLQPANGFRGFPEAFPRDLKSGLRNIGDRDIPVLPFKQVVNQSRCAAAYIND